MSAECCAPDAPITPSTTEVTEETARPWWRDFDILIPVFSGVAFILGLICKWTSLETAALALFWIGLLLGASTFVPGALRVLFLRRKVGIALLMTISAVGAVLLGYVEEAAALAFLYSIAEALEDKAMDRARGGLRALLKLVPETATVVRGGTAVEIPARELTIGQVLRVRPGDRVATDGVVVSGQSSVDTSAITGESIPVDVAPGDAVSAGAINTAGVLELKATANGTDNSLTTIVGLVEQAQAKKGERARLADRIARPLVPGVIILSLLVGVLGILFGGEPSVWITRALVVLVAASPCALAIAVPVTVVSAIGAASKFGVIVKSGAAFEQLGTIRHLAVDKTGTLTRNQPSVTTVVTIDGVAEAEVLSAAAAMEQHSTHPLATAIVAAVDTVPTATEVKEEAGHGITGTVDAHTIAVGSPRWIDAAALATEVDSLEAAGQTCVLVTRDGAVIGAIGIRDELRPEVPDVVETLQTNGVAISMLTGDNTRTAEALGAIAGISKVYAQLRPEDKAHRVAELAKHTPTAMIGDGINDSPALASATVGIAMGATGADAAIESADVAFTGHDLRLIPQALQHARRGRTIINQNIALSLAIITILLPLAITGVLGLAAVVLIHEAAEVVVIANGLRAARTPGRNRVKHSNDNQLTVKTNAGQQQLDEPTPVA